MTIDDLVNLAFSRAQSPRSDEYKAGVHAILVYWANQETCTCPYPSGSAQADAFFAGVAEGHDIWRDWNDRRAAAAVKLDSPMPNRIQECVVPEL